jgi:hypothetical protein
MDAIQNAATKPTTKAADIRVLHCLNPQCDGLLAYEVDASNVLYVDLAWMARRDGDMSYFPCPKCGGKNIVEEYRTEKGLRHRVTHFLT